MSHDITTIIGGGVVGLSIAWRLASLGRRVRLIDAGPIMRGASWAAAGIFPAPPSRNVSDPIDQLRSLSHEIFPDWIGQLEARSGIDIGFSRCGGIYLARSRGELATLIAQQSWWDEHGINYDRWSVEQFLQISDTFGPLAKSLQQQGFPCPIWLMPDECQLRPPRLLAALLAACIAAGVEVIEQQIVEAIIPKLNGSIQIATTSRIWTSEQVCIASGAWAQRLLDDINIQTGILPIRGQMLLYKLPHKPFSQVLNDGHRYLVPRDDGYVLAGSCEEEVGFKNETSAEKIAELQQWVASILPGWNEAYFQKSWAGLRPGVIDGLPYIGRLPQQQNIFIAAGHYRSGLHLAPATAEILVALLQGSVPPIDISPFHIQRGLTASANW